MPMPAETIDVAIVGGGIMGSAVAYFLTADPAWRGRVAVIERDPSYARASTALSAASIRQQFSSPINIAISRFGFSFFAQVGETLAVGEERPDIRLTERGYLFLATAAGRATLAARHRVQQAADAPVTWLEPAALADRFAWLATDDLAAGTYGERTEGWYDAYALLLAFRAKARAQGAVYRHATVAGLTRRGARIDTVTLADGTRIAPGIVVNAAGPQARAVAAMAGLDLPVSPRARSVFVFEARDPPPALPLVIDPTGVYVRPDGPLFLTGTAPPPDRDPETEELAVDHTLFDEVIWPALAHRIPAFEAIRVVRAWTGLYAMNPVDQNALIGPHPDCLGLLLANGFSGHGLQQSPAVGRGLAEWIAHGRYLSLDLSPLSLARLRDGRPLIEHAVV